MCIFFFTLDHPVFCLIAASNRDEFLARPTRDAAWHDFNGGGAGSILSGIDAHPAGGGTWLGISRSGRFGSLLNYTERPPPPPKHGIDRYLSRGELVRRWLVEAGDASDGPAHLSGRQSLEAYLDDVHAKRDHFPGFNLLIGQVEPATTTATAGKDDDEEERTFKLGYVSNRTSGQDDKPLILKADHPLEGGNKCVVCGLSNSVYQDPWPKVQAGKAALDRTLQEWDASVPSSTARRDPTEAEEDDLVERLFTLLGTNSEPDVPEPQLANIRSTIQVPPVQLPIAMPAVRATGATSAQGSKASAGAATPVPSSTDAQAPSRTTEGNSSSASSDVELGWYGTRLSTVILIRRRDGAATFVERDVFQLGRGEDGDGAPRPRRAKDKGKSGERKFRWVIQAQDALSPR